MSLRKFQGNLLFDGQEVLPGKKVLIVAENGRIETIVDAEIAGDDVQSVKGIVSPP